MYLKVQADSATAEQGIEGTQVNSRVQTQQLRHQFYTTPHNLRLAQEANDVYTAVLNCHSSLYSDG